MIYADHNGVKTDAASLLDDEWFLLFEEQAEIACRRYGKGAAFVVEATHTDSRACEGKP